ncbi:MAG: hypothetical protein ABIH34_03735 [Nanoarchaeota archaeon]
MITSLAQRRNSFKLEFLDFILALDELDNWHARIDWLDGRIF